jgi:CBS domain containing-hemolysin-like protein
MIELLYIFLIIVGYFLTYIVSLYSLAVYVDPDEIESLIPSAGKTRRILLEKMAGDPRAFMHIAELFKSFALIIITIFGVLVSNKIAEIFDVHSVLALVATLIIVWLFFVFAAEILPRFSSRRANNKGKLRHLWVFFFLYLIFYPIVKMYRSLLQKSGGERTVSEEEKEDIVERAIETVADHAGISQTIVDDEEKEMISQIFLLDQTLVKEIMIPRIDIIAFEKSTSFKEIRKIIQKDGHSRYPVYDETIDKVLGLLYVKDLFNNMPDQGEIFDVTRFLRKPYLIPENKIIGELLREFKDKRQHIAMVIDEFGGIAGLVTLEDIIEEIFGEIQDEHDYEQDDIIQLKDGRLLVNANIMVEKLQDYLETEYEQTDYDTISGLIYDLVGSVPSENQTIKWNDLEFEVHKKEDQRILSVKVRKR